MEYIDASALIEKALSLGIDRIGVARACRVPAAVSAAYERWIERGGNASMKYLERYPDVRCDPRELLSGTCSVISCAISYYHTECQPSDVPAIASYAHGDDYHDVVRHLLEPVALWIRETYGGETRICVDTAPVHERYWAIASGIGFRGHSGLVIVPGLGTYCFLAEILSTVPFKPTLPLERTECDSCGKCVKACPGGAIEPGGEVDAKRCLSYLTIEHRDELPEGLSTGGRLYGCDTCQTVCPHNQGLKPTRHSEFRLRPAYSTLTAERIESMTAEEYTEVFHRSAIKRAKLTGLKRNIRFL